MSSAERRSRRPVAAAKHTHRSRRLAVAGDGEDVAGPEREARDQEAFCPVERDSIQWVRVDEVTPSDGERAMLGAARTESYLQRWASIQPDQPDSTRRTVYSEVSRMDLNPMLARFDFPDRNAAYTATD